MNTLSDQMRKRRPEVIFIAVFFLIFLPISFVFAQDGIVPACEGSECGICDLAVLLQNVLNFIITLSVSVAGVMFAYAGVLYISSPSSTENVKKAHSIFSNVLVGLIVVLGAWIIINTLLNALVGGDFAMPWNTIPGCSGSMN